MQTPSHAQTAPQPGYRVLVIEDEGLVAALLEDMLTELGYHIAASVGRLAEAMAIADTGIFDMAILDVNLGGIPSYPVAECLMGRAIPVVLATGYGAEGVDARFAHLPVLRKPFALADLEKTLAAIRPAAPTVS